MLFYNTRPTLFHLITGRSLSYKNIFVKKPVPHQYLPNFLTVKPEAIQYTKKFASFLQRTPTVSPVSNVLDWGFFFPKINPFRSRFGNKYQLYLKPQNKSLRTKAPKLSSTVTHPLGGLNPLFKRRKLVNFHHLPSFANKVAKKTPMSVYGKFLKQRRPATSTFFKKRALSRLPAPVKNPLITFTPIEARQSQFGIKLPQSKPSLFSVIHRHNPIYDDVGLTKIEMVRFKPGLLFQWKELRLHFAALSKLKANSHAKITRFVVMQKATTGFAFIKTIALSAFFLLKQASLINNPFLLKGLNFKAIQTSAWVLNGTYMLNPLVQIYPGDILTTPTLNYDVTELSTRTKWAQVRFFRRWKLHQRKLNILSTPSYLEVDELTQTVVLLFNPTKLSQLDPSIWSARPFLTHRMLNWKQLT